MQDADQRDAAGGGGEAAAVVGVCLMCVNVGGAAAGRDAVMAAPLC
jgi:hypothetical protein